MNPSGSLEGVEELKAALATCEDRIARKHSRNALKAGAEVIRRELVAFAPVDSGLTRNEIKVKKAKRSRSKIAMVISISGLGFKGKTFYAGFVNYGWTIGKRLSGGRLGKRIVNISGLKNFRGVKYRAQQEGKHIAGTRWMNKAFQDASPMAVQVVQETLRKALLEEIAASTAKK